jgi:hypothetical protein
MITKTYYNLFIMLKDMEAHAKAFPRHKFLPADSGGKIVYVAYDPNETEDDCRGQWEIPMRYMVETMIGHRPHIPISIDQEEERS